MTFQKPDTGYWERKFIAYMHDPIDKILQIRGHEERAALFLEKFGLQKPNEEFWKKADGIAAGFERGQVPTYSSDDNKNGAIDFLKRPIITHPTSEEKHLKIDFKDIKPDSINDALIKFIEENIGIKAGTGGYSDKFKGDEAKFAVARVLYTHLALRFKLAEKDIGGLGALWHRIPADTRFPDHSIWQHNSLCSALSSCMELAGNQDQIGMMVFSITPVQPFIAKARKLRDYWTGSVLLSWLAFEGMRWVMENLGPDHILYPSLVDQPLINEYLQKEWRVKKDGFINTEKNIASFPNKFLFLVPMSMADSIAEEIKKHINMAWQALHKNCSDYLCSQLNDITEVEKDYVKKLFCRQNDNFWEMQWAATRLVTKNDKDGVSDLLPASSFTAQCRLLDVFNEIIKDKPYENKGHGTLYSVSHSLVQSTLAAIKTKKCVRRAEEPGEKCHQCGEFEVLHAKEYTGDIAAREYKKNIDLFWGSLKEKWDGDEKNQFRYDFNKNEKLCSICAVKRIAYKVIEINSSHVLHETFDKQKGFESTTEMSLRSYFMRENIPEEKRKDVAQKIHDKTEDGVNNRDRYYAILQMDGDKMGKLVNGETLAATWQSIMHPDIVKRFNDPAFEKKYYDNWQTIFKECPKRLLTPAIHAAISESLADFSIYGVASIIKNHHGRLIYAGGDDVCAVLPVCEAFDAANEIQKYYRSAFKLIGPDGNPHDIDGTWKPEAGKLSINLGKGDNISISAGILVCHHKESLSQMILNAQAILKTKAKKEAGRNACAIELRKRSGGSRYFVRKWDDISWKAFREIGDAIEDKRKVQVSTSLVYRLENFRDGIEAILLDKDTYKDNLKKFIAKQLDRSSVGNNENGVAEMMTDIVVEIDKDGKKKFKPEGLIVAAFMARGGKDDE